MFGSVNVPFRGTDRICLYAFKGYFQESCIFYKLFITFIKKKTVIIKICGINDKDIVRTRSLFSQRKKNTGSAQAPTFFVTL